MRSVSATRASIGRAGWQQVKIRRSRSSGISCIESSIGQRLEARELFRLVAAHPLTPEPVEGPIARGGGDPGAGVLRKAVQGPAFECSDERLLDGLLGEVEAAGDADQRRDRPSRLPSEQALDDVGRDERSYDCGAIPVSLKSITGRTSIAPYLAPGHRLAASSAWSRFSHSSR